ncbi:hypothetical protein IZU99_09905 [Oscillospiraceae bacterium CM]|nr:hypothetical protein IZU99_09905 [Oscillospiraceae bacterium CM]
MPVVLYWFIKRYAAVSQRREWRLFVLLLFLMGVSTVLSFFLNPAHIYDNTTLLVELLMMFIYYFMFAYYAERYPLRVKGVLIGFILFVTAFAVVYNVDKSLYQDIKFIWNPRMATAWMTTDFTGYRFGFFWMDENNIGYMANAVVLFILCHEKTSLFTKALLLGALTLIVISCMSSGALLSTVISVGLYMVYSVWRFITGRVTFRWRLTNVVLFVLLAVILYFLIPRIPDYLGGTVAQESFSRIAGNSASSRLSIWKNILQQANFFQYLLIGQGGDTFLNDAKISPHNGHLFWILAYGIISYVIFMVMFFRKRKTTPPAGYLFMIPIWIGFTINILLGEVKLAAILALLVALSCGSRPMTMPQGRQEVLNA